MKKHQRTILTTVILIFAIIFGLTAGAAAPVVPKPANSLVTVKVTAPSSARRGETIEITVTLTDFAQKLTTEGISCLDAKLHYNSNIFEPIAITEEEIKNSIINLPNKDSTDWDFSLMGLPKDGNYYMITLMTFSPSNIIYKTSDFKMVLKFKVKDNAALTDDVYFWVNDIGVVNSVYDEVAGSGSYVQINIQEKQNTYVSGIFTFILNDNNTADLKSVSTSGDTVTIPENVVKDGKTYKVIKLLDDSFNGASALKTLIIPCTVTEIGKLKTSYGSGFTVGGCKGSKAEAFASANSFTFNHNTEGYIESSRTEAACTENGSITYKCKNCESTYSTVINAKGHSYGAWVIIVQPTLTSTGEQKRTCNDCDAFDIEVLPKLNATQCKHTSTKIDHKDATCAETGHHKIICNDCGTVTSQTTLQKISHVGGEVEDKAATCSESGYHRQKCKNCNEYMVNTTIPKLSHTGGTLEIKDATCSSEGYKKQKCTSCGTLMINQTLAKTSHAFGLWTVVTEPTADAEGSKERSCAVCSHKETEAIASLGSVSKEESSQPPEESSQPPEESSQINEESSQITTESSIPPATSDDNSSAGESEKESNSQQFVLILIMAVVVVLGIGYAVIMYIRKKRSY